MVLEGVTKALKESRCRLHACREASAVRVARLEKDGQLIGYGADATIEEALIAAGEHYISSGAWRKKRPASLLGNPDPVGELDRFIYRGHILTAHWNGTMFLCELFGHTHVLAPQEVREKAQETKRPVEWKFRGFTYVVSLDSSGGISMDCKYRGIDAWEYWSKKVGEAQELGEAISNALRAEPVEAS